jgi:UDP-2,4-diacetamido-2,4,6-trideoxy-beta-L-altropyranose hydrolase
MNCETLIIRADANPQMGIGHVLRCLALAQAWVTTGGKVVFAMTTSAKPLQARLCAAGAQVVYLAVDEGSGEDAGATVALARQYHATWVVVDGYHFGMIYQQRLKEAKLQVLVIDDYGHAKRYYADVVLNHNGHAHESLYTVREPETRLLLGPRYALLRREFGQQRLPRCETAPIACRLLVTLGGSDPAYVTGKVLQALAEVTSDLLETMVVVGVSNPHVERISAQTRSVRRAPRLVQQVPSMAPLMKWADFAIAAAGTTAWELAFMGVPSMLIPLAENQRAVADKLGEAGAAVNLGWHESLTPGVIADTVKTLMVASEKRRQMSERGRSLVDGHGAARVVAALKDNRLRLRTVEAGDCRLLWQWANDSSVRGVSFKSDPITWESHQAWFQTKLNDPHCVFYVAVDANDTPQAQVRYDCDDNEAVVSISVDQRTRGTGCGTMVLRQSADQLFAATSVTTIHAYIKTGNIASLRAFEKAGYHKTVEDATTPQVTHLTLKR